jgi:hypothetical protein
MAARTSLARLDRRWQGVVYGPLAWAFFAAGVVLFVAAAIVPLSAFDGHLWLSIWFSAFAIWFASASILTSAKAAAERDSWTAVVSGGWSLVLCLLAVSIAIAALSE